MKEFFKVTDLKEVLKYAADLPCVESEEIPLHESHGRILATDIISDINLPDFMRSTMDGYAVRAQSTFGTSEENPAYLNLKGSVKMGTVPSFTVKTGEAASIPTGGMLPKGTDSVVMVEYAEAIDDVTIEVYHAVAPGQHVIEVGEDIKKGEKILSGGRKLRSQETGVLAALGKSCVKVYKRPLIGIISTGDEVVPTTDIPEIGQIRDINTYTLSGLVKKAGGIPVSFGIVRDNFHDLLETSSAALAQTDMVLISGGSSVGMRDFTTQVLSSLPDSIILAHGISISPGKPTILAKVGNKAFWGLPGHVVSAMVVFTTAVRPFIEQISGLSPQYQKKPKLTALLSRNISSAQGRVDFVRIRLMKKDGVLWAEPLLGKSGLINTMLKADGMIKIGINTEGVDKGTEVEIIAL